MCTLLGEVNLWTFDDNINIENTDFGAFRYNDKRIDHLYEEGKRSYAQKRGMIYVPTNKKGNKLKDSIKFLEEQLRENSTIYCQWYDRCIVQLILSNGLLIQIQVNVTAGDIQRIIFDKYLVGKVSDHITDVTISKNHLVCTYNEHQVTLVWFTKPKRHASDKISKLEPKISTIDLFGLNGRRLDKKIQMNNFGDLIIIWWKSSMNDVYPWSPTVKEHDRANVHLYRLTGIKLELICYIRTEFDPLCITFDACHDSVIHSVEQKVSRKGEVTIEWRTYEVSQQDKLKKITVDSVPLPTHTSCIKFSPTQEVLLLCCIDGSVTLYDQTKGTSSCIKAAFIPTLVSWHTSGILFTVGNDRGQFEHFDISLSCIKCETLNENTVSTNILDLSVYFSRNQPTLLRMEWNKKRDKTSYDDHHCHGDSLFLLLFERGPIGVIKVIDGEDLSGDTLVRQYLAISQVEQATNLLLSLNWNTESRICMHALNQILNYLFKLPLTTDRENLIQNALGSFHVPSRPLSQSTEDKYGDEVRDLTRRFFHHLLRNQMFDKAFRLAIDLNDHDLFMDIHFYALVVNDIEMASAAKEKAEHILSRSNSCRSSHSRCSRASCSTCSDSSSEKGDESYTDESDDAPKQDLNSYKCLKKHTYKKSLSSQIIPPLPVLHPHCGGKTLLPTSYHDDTSLNKTDYNLMSTSFNTPNNTHASNTFNQSSHISISNTFFSSTSFTNPYKTHSSLMSASTISSSNTLNNPISDGLMTTAFGNFCINEPKITGHQESGQFFKNNSSTPQPNDLDYSFDESSTDTIAIASQEENSFISTPFNSATVESTDIASTQLTLDVVNTNVMSTSFSTHMPNVVNLSDPSHNVIPEDSSSTLLLNTQTCDATNSLMNETHTSAISNKLPSFYNTSKNLISTSFISPEGCIRANSDGDVKDFNTTHDYSDKAHQTVVKRKQTNCSMPLPPSVTGSITNYLQNLPKKNTALSRSTSGLTDLESCKKCIPSKRPISTTQSLHRQNSTIIQGQQRHINLLPSRIYRVDYELDHIPFHGSCDNIDLQPSGAHTRGSINNLHHVYPNYITQNKLLENKYLRLASGENSANASSKFSSNVPPLPVINVTTSNSKTYPSCPTLVDTPVASNEKPKVKFSDTVTQILVPGVGQSYRQKRPIVAQTHMTDPKRELAESLPLCLGNEDYLKDFQPLSRDDDTVKEISKTEESAKIKVVHFGLL